MPRVTVTDEPTLIYKSLHGNASTPTQIEMRIDPEEESDAVIYLQFWTSKADCTVTAGGTDADTDGLPLLHSEVKDSLKLLKGMSYWAVAPTGESFDVYFDVSGAR